MQALSAEELHLRLPALLSRLQRDYEAQASFAAHASHELRTPLAASTTELEVALARPRTEAEWQRVAETVLHDIRRASHLLDVLLKHARSTLERRPDALVDLGELVARVTKEHEALAAGAGLVLGAELPAEHSAAVLLGDADTLGTALANLVANAIRYTPRGGRVLVRVEAGHLSHRVHVDDSGPGVSANEADVIFTPFVRGVAGQRAAAAGTQTGSGLGLTLARQVAQAHDGALTVSTSGDGGARFTIEVPAAR